MRISDGLGRDAAKSTLVHALAAAAVLAVGSGAVLQSLPDPEATDLATHLSEEATRDLLPAAAAPPRPAADAPAPPPPPEAALTTEVVEARLHEALTGELDAEDEAAMLAAADEWLREHADSLDLEDLSPEELAAVTEQMRREALEAMQGQVKNLAREALLDEVRRQLDGEIHRQITSRIESELQGRLGDQVKDRLRDELNKDRRERFEEAVKVAEGLRDDLRDAASKLESARNDARGEKFDEAEGKRAEAAAATAETLAAATTSLAELSANVPQLSEVIAAAGPAVDPAAAAAPIAEAQAPLAEKKKDDAARELEEARAALRERSDGVQRLREAIDRARNTQEPDPVSQGALAELLPRLREMLAAELAKQSLDPLAEAVTGRLVEAFKEEAERFGIAEAELRAMLAGLARERIAHNLQGEAVEIDPAFAQLRAELRLRTPDEIAKAQEAAATARQELESLRDAQAAIAPPADAAQAEEVAKQQESIAGRYDAVAERIDAAAEAARAASPRSRDRMNNLARAMTEAESRGRLAVLPEAIRGGEAERVQELKNPLVEHWTRGIDALREAEAALGEERQQAEAAAAAAAQQGAAVGEARLAALGEAMGEDVRAIASEMLPGVIAGAGEVSVRGTQGLDARLAGMGDLLGELNQLALNAAEGRDSGGLDAMSMGLGGLAGRSGIGGFGQGFGAGGRGSRMDMYNAIAIEKFGKELRDRANPDTYYDTVGETSGLASFAAPVDASLLPATVYFEPDAETTSDGATPAADEQRKVPEPAFKTQAFAAAAMMEKPPVLDGDLSDWGELRHPVPTRFEDTGEPAKEPTDVYFRWSPDGLYVGYTTKKAGPVVPNAEHGWMGDCIEVWLDTDNTRVKQMKLSDAAHQFFLMPFGYRGDPHVTFAEHARGTRGRKVNVTYAMGDLGKAAAKVKEGEGYTVEAFISRRAMFKPRLFPGAYVAMNFSLNRGVNTTDWQQWASPKAWATWDKPDIWGDLLLLGSDGRASFVDAADMDQPAKPIAPGAPFGVEVRDKDMDLNTNKRDLLPAMLTVSGAGESLLVILEETSPDSGVFRGSVATQPFAAPPKANTLNVRGGETIRLLYTDARAEYGEQNRVVTASLKVGVPVHILAAQ